MTDEPQSLNASEQTTSDRERLADLRRVLSQRFDQDELRALCFDLGITYDDLSGGNKEAKIITLLGYLERRQRLPELLQKGKEQRPDIPWPELPASPHPPAAQVKKLTWQALIAHADGEDELAAQLVAPLQKAGYTVAYQGLALEGENIAPQAAPVLDSGGPLLLCATVKAVGTGWAYRLVQAARLHNKHTRVFAIQADADAFVQMLAPDSVIVFDRQNPASSAQDLLTTLQKYYPLRVAHDYDPLGYDAEQRYRELALESCDIIDLAALPEQDRHIAARQLELRRLYVALRVQVELTPGADGPQDELEALEKRRRAFEWGGIEIGDLVVSAQSNERRAEIGERERVAVGQRLAQSRRLVVLGDPGAGKTTLLRWISTAYLLRLKHDPDWKELPDVATLPDQDWLPIIVRCRDLDPASLRGCLDDILGHTLRKAEMTEAESAALKAVLRAKLGQGQALLLVDGLDEITDPAARISFCRQIEQIHVAYPQAPIIVTSRIVGYREMGRRIGRGFEHLTIAPLTREDKDDFARRWCKLTERPERLEAAIRELVDDVHSTERIERLTGTPLLLTTMALVKRKVGKLPSRRADLYWEAVQVLLNWRREVDQPLNYREALPQLEYVAYEMCDRGVQQLREDEILDLLERMRAEYPQVHAAHAHTPAEFLRLLERRTGLMVKVGRVRHLGRPEPVFEFRHLTFQEYLAARALVDGKFPGRDRSKSLAQHVAPLAGRVGQVKDSRFEGEPVVTENWREALRLCVVSCHSDDVNDVLLAILTPLEGEDVEVIARPRAVMAAMCLADEPEVSEDVALAVLREFARQVGADDGVDDLSTSVDAAAVELTASQWGEKLRHLLIEEFRRRDAATRVSNQANIGGLAAIIGANFAPGGDALHQWFVQQVQRLEFDAVVAIDAALIIMELAFREKAQIVPNMVDRLLVMLTKSAPEAHAAAWALHWLNFKPIWKPSAMEMEKILSVVCNSAADVGAIYFLILVLRRERYARSVEPLIARLYDKNNDVREAAANALGHIGDTRAIEPLIFRLDDQSRGMRVEVVNALGQIKNAQAVEALTARLDNQDRSMQRAAANALGQIGDARAIEVLITRLNDQDSIMRRAALGGLSRTCQDETDRKLLSDSLRGWRPFLDPQDAIDDARVRHAAQQLDLPVEQIRQRYEALAQQFHLKLAWQP